jgi:hypothetical protein
MSKQPKQSKQSKKTNLTTYDPKILDSYQKRLEYELSQHSRVLQKRD